MSDESATAARVADPGIRALYRLENRWQSWLDVEAALSHAQEALGIIPAGTAAAIAGHARLDLLDRARIDAATARTGHPIVPLVWELARVVGEPAGGWVHWGATTQNIMQTGDLLVLRQAHAIFLGLLHRILASMAALAEQGADTVMPGRTHGQHAIPITFGFKVAVWIDEMLRHRARLREAEQRVFVTMLGGAAGTFAALGTLGPAVQEGVARRLGMAPMAIPARTAADHLAEYVALLGLLGATCGKIGREIYTLMKTEFGELEEPVPEGAVGSSTMPQKRNPHLCQDVIAGAAELRALVPLALEAMQIEHEADRSASLMIRDATSRACIALGDTLARLDVILAGLHVDAARMRANLDLGGGLIMAEAVMIELGLHVGRQRAHDIVYEAAQAAFTGRHSFAALLLADPRVTDKLAPDAVRKLLDPTAYVGQCASLARQAAQRARTEG